MSLTRVAFVLITSVSITACSKSDDDAPGGSGGSTETDAGAAGAGGGGRSGAGGGGSAGSTAGGAGSAGSGGAAGSSAVDAGGAGAGGVDAAPADTGSDAGAAAVDAGTPTMSFFVTSRSMGKGGNLGGLAGADAHCQALAMAVSSALGAKTWHAYLSTAAASARDRIGNGPWYNAKGKLLAKNVAELHDQAANSPLKATWPIGDAAYDVILDETGKGHRESFMTKTQHDILTGSTEDGKPNGSNHCSNWTSTTGTSTVGHSNREGGGRAPSWSSAHPSGCGPEIVDGKQVNGASGTVTQGGGRG